MWMQRSWCQTRPGPLPSIRYAKKALPQFFASPKHLCTIEFQISVSWDLPDQTVLPWKRLWGWTRQSLKGCLRSWLAYSRTGGWSWKVCWLHLKVFNSLPSGEFQKVWGRVLWRHQGCRPTVRHWQSWQVIIFKLNSLPRSPNAQRARWHSKIQMSLFDVICMYLVLAFWLNCNYVSIVCIFWTNLSQTECDVFRCTRALEGFQQRLGSANLSLDHCVSVSHCLMHLQIFPFIICHICLSVVSLSKRQFVGCRMRKHTIWQIMAV